MTMLAAYAETFTFIGTFDHENEVVPFALANGWTSQVVVGAEENGDVIYGENPVTAGAFCKAIVGQWLIDKLAEPRLQTTIKAITDAKNQEVANTITTIKTGVGSKITAVLE